MIIKGFRAILLEATIEQKSLIKENLLLFGLFENQERR